MKQQIIHQIQFELRQLQHKLEVLESLEQGFLYEYHDTFQSSNFMGRCWNYLVRVKSLSPTTVRFDVFACTQEPSNSFDLATNFGTITKDYRSIDTIKRVDPKDLTLYMGWKYKSPALVAIYAGKSRLRLK